MATRHSGSELAKLSRPRLFDALPRERLFSLLDGCRKCPATWIAAPPGAGKTTLVASYVEARDIDYLWFQVDAGDNDPATLFYYLSLADGGRADATQERAPLPLLTPEHLPDIAGFARRFFRELYRRLARPACLVFDNSQEVDENSPLHELMCLAIESAPEGVSLVLISRLDPPSAYAHAVANRVLTVLDWNPLKLTREEAGRIVATHAGLDDNAVDALHERCGGWAAGLILLAERLRRCGEIETLDASESLQDVFAYFAGQMFDQASAGDRRMLLLLSYLPAITPNDATALTGSSAAPELLDGLYRRHLFTDRRNQSAPSYQFHALFRAFLQHRANLELGAEQRQTGARRAAQLLDAAGRIEDAMALHLSAQDWIAADALVQREAQNMIAQGRWRVVVDWIEAMPAKTVESSGWLLHWLGTAWIAVDPPKARGILERCHARAVDTGDTHCELQAAAGFVETYFLEYAEFAPLDRWIEVLERLADGAIIFPTVESELRVQSALLIALTYRQAGHFALPGCAVRCMELLQTGADANLRVFASVFLELYGTMCGRLEFAAFAHRLARPLLDRPEVTSLTKALSLGIGIWTCVHTEDFDQGLILVEQAERLGERENLHLAKRFACVIGCYLDFRRGDLKAADDKIRRFAQFLIPSAPYEAASIVGMQCYRGLFTGRPEEAIGLIDELRDRYDRTGSLCHRLFMRSVIVWCYTALGRFDDAAREITAFHALMPARHMEWMDWGPLACEAWIALQQRDDTLYRDRLRAMFAETRSRSFGYGFGRIWSHAWMPRLAADALTLGIGAENVRHYIREQRVLPPGQSAVDWPWPVRIRTLGSFELEIDDNPVAFTGKSPKKLLALLKCLVAFGARDVPEAKITDALWPDEDGDAAHRAYTIALHRLRKLLGGPERIVQKAGRVSVDLDVCWIDLLAFDALAQQIRDTPAKIRFPSLETTALRAVNLHTAEFLAGDVDEPWILAARARHRQRFTEIVSLLGAYYEGQKRWEDALRIYHQGVETDTLAETFYQGLMRCNQRVGRAAEAAAIYRRLCEILSKELGVPPSPSSEQLYRSITLQ